MKKIYSLLLLAAIGLFGAQSIQADVTIYVDVDNVDWASVNCYYWGESDAPAWPGTAMTQLSNTTGNTTIYKYTISGNPTGIIFNDGSSQTVDITEGIESGKLYVISNSQDASGHYTGSWAESSSFVVFPKDAKILFDATSVGKWMKIHLVDNGLASAVPTPDGNGSANEWQAATIASDVITFTLNNDWVISSSTQQTLYEVSVNDTWSYIPATIPTDNTYRMITVSADGSSFTWSVPQPEVRLSADKEGYLPGETITLTAKAYSFSGDVTYAYSYSTDGGTTWTAMAGNTLVAGDCGTKYTFKVVASYAAASETAETTTTAYVIVLTIAGTDKLCGTSWNTTDENNNMIYADGKFTWSTSSPVALPVSNGESKQVEFKAVQNHTWWPCWPTENYVVVIPKAGYYNVTIEFDWSKKEFTVTPTYLYPIVKLIGSFTDNWSTDAAIELEKEAGQNVWSKEVELSAYWPGFKLIVDDAWMTNSSSSKDLTRAANSASVNYKDGDDNNMYLKVDVFGTYTFTYDASGETPNLIVAFPTEFTRAGSANYGSLCVPFDASISNAKVFRIGSVSGNVVTLTDVDADELEAGKSYIIKSIDAAANMVITKNGENVAGSPAEDDYHKGVLGSTVTVTESYNAYVLMDNMLTLVGEGGSVEVASTKAYFYLPASQGAPAYRIVEATGEATGIEAVEASEEAVKFLENGQLFIRKNGVVYDVTGAVVR